MSNMRVFELAKEMNLPAKQLLQRIRKLGIPVSSNFNALSDEQIAIIRKKIGSPTSPPPSRPAKESPAQIISTRREDTNPEGTLELDSDTLIGGKRPRRIRRRRSKKHKRKISFGSVVIGKRRHLHHLNPLLRSSKK